MVLGLDLLKFLFEEISHGFRPELVKSSRGDISWF